MCGFLDGKNALIFSYGVTNAGKTHTIQGEDQITTLSLSVVLKLCLVLRDAKGTGYPPTSAGWHLSCHWRPPVPGDGPETLPPQRRSVSGSWPSQAGAKCQSCHFCFSQRSKTEAWIQNDLISVKQWCVHCRLGMRSSQTQRGFRALVERLFLPLILHSAHRSAW